MPELLLTNANVLSAPHPTAPLCSVLFAIWGGGGVHIGQRYNVPRAESVERDAGAVSPATSGCVCGEGTAFSAQ